MHFGDDEDSSSSGSDASSDDGSNTVDLSDKQGVVDPADLKQYDPTPPSLDIQEPPPPSPPDDSSPGLRGDDPQVAISGRAVTSNDLPQDAQTSGSSGSDSDDDGNSGSNDGNN